MTNQLTYSVLLPAQKKPLLSESIYELICDLGNQRWTLCAQAGWISGFKRYDSVELTARTLDGHQRRAGAYAERSGLIEAARASEEGSFYTLTEKGRTLIQAEEHRRDEQRVHQDLWNDHLRICDKCRMNIPEEDRAWFTPPYVAENVAFRAAQHTAPCSDGRFFERLVG